MMKFFKKNKNIENKPSVEIKQKESLQDIKLKEVKLPELDELKKECCYVEKIHNVKFMDFWTKILRLEPIDLNSLTVPEFYSVGMMLNIGWDGDFRSDNLISSYRGRLHELKHGNYFKVIMLYSSEKDKTEGNYCFMGLTSDLHFIDQGYDHMEEEYPKYELRKLFGIGGIESEIFDSINNPPVIKSKTDDKLKECTPSEMNSMKMSNYWKNVLNLPEEDFNSFNCGQIDSITKMLYQDDNYINGINYFSLISMEDGKLNFALTKDYYYVEGETYLNYDEPSKEIKTLLPEIFEIRSKITNTDIVKAFGHLWGCKFITKKINNEIIYKLQYCSYEYKKFINKITEYFDENGRRHYKCKWINDDHITNIQEGSLIQMIINQKIEQEMIDKWSDQECAEFVIAFLQGTKVRKIDEIEITKSHKDIILKLSQRGKIWLQLWDMENKLDKFICLKNKKCTNLFSQVDLNLFEVVNYLNKTGKYGTVLLDNLNGKQIISIKPINSSERYCIKF